MSEKEIKITKKQFDRYRRVQYSGLYNMFFPEARAATGLTKEQYTAIIRNYTALAEKYGEYEEEDR